MPVFNYCKKIIFYSFILDIISNVVKKKTTNMFFVVTRIWSKYVWIIYEEKLPLNGLIHGHKLKKYNREVLFLKCKEWHLILELLNTI